MATHHVPKYAEGKVRRWMNRPGQGIMLHTEQGGTTTKSEKIKAMEKFHRPAYKVEGVKA